MFTTTEGLRAAIVNAIEGVNKHITFTAEKFAECFEMKNQKYMRYSMNCVTGGCICVNGKYEEPHELLGYSKNCVVFALERLNGSYYISEAHEKKLVSIYAKFVETCERKAASSTRLSKSMEIGKKHGLDTEGIGLNHGVAKLRVTSYGWSVNYSLPFLAKDATPSFIAEVAQEDAKPYEAVVNRVNNANKEIEKISV